MRTAFAVRTRNIPDPREVPGGFFMPSFLRLRLPLKQFHRLLEDAGHGNPQQTGVLDDGDGLVDNASAAHKAHMGSL